MMSFKLNEKELKTASLEAVPFSDSESRSCKGREMVKVLPEPRV